MEGMKLKMEKSKIQNILFVLTLILVSIAMFYFIGKKEGYHEDEIFSYGSSNYKHDNVFQAASDRDSINRTLDELVYKDNLIDTIKSAKYYLIDHFDVFCASYGEKIATDKPIWKTPEDAKAYLTVSKDEIFNYWPVLFNQGRDVHPPLFYMLVHFVSSIFLNTFSKYIIFIINLLFFIGICIVIRKIMQLYNKDYLTIPAILLYGLSMGAVSTVILLRMYSMLTFFCILYLYINLKIVKNDFKINKKLSKELVITTILGFLTQYYFCVFAFIIFLIMITRMITLKYKKEGVKYFLKHAKSALIGMLIFLPCIYHIFFSYRRPGNFDSGSYFEKLKVFLEIIFNSYSIPTVVAYTLAATSIIYVITNIIIKAKKKEKNNIFEICIIALPVILYVLIIAKITPIINEKYMIRYVMPILPLIAICVILLLENILNKTIKQKEKIKITIIYIIVIAISIIGFFTNEPKYLYKGYSKYIQIARAYKDLDYIYVCDNAFTYLNSLPEFLIYNKTMILNSNHDDLSILGADEQLQSQDEFILTIKKWMNVDATLNDVLKASGFSNYEVLLNQEDDTESIIYLVSR